jgi:hypothetical protein
MTGAVTIYHDPFNRWIHLICAGKMAAGEFEQGLHNAIEALRANGYTDLIIDCALAPDDAYASLWASNHWLRAAEANGLRRLAFVHSPLSLGVPPPGPWSGAVAFFPCHSLGSATWWLTRKS